MGNSIKTWWGKLSTHPFGKWIFSRILGWLIPYTGTIRPNIVKLGPGSAEVFIKDTRRNRNHLQSIHALALGNLGELTTGLALHFGMETNKRAILTNLNVEFPQKSAWPDYGEGKHRPASKHLWAYSSARDFI